MAFQQPQPRPKPIRQVSVTLPPNQQQHPELQAPASPSRKRAIEDSQEWILFQPQSDLQSLSQTTSRTPRTATHLSEFGSLETHVRSQQHGDSQDQDDREENGTCQGTDIDDEGAELDSLDEGLVAFHHPFAPSSANLDQSGGAVLPTHDGLGSFFPSSAGIQEQLWQFERHNPHRRSSKHVRRRSSVQRRLDAMDEEQDVVVEDERTERIEKWRLDQSRAVLEEIEREARRRRRRMSRASGTDARPSLQSSAGLERVSSRTDSATAKTQSTLDQPPSESFWRRITRKVIQDLIGLDENTLSVIFGEQFVDEASPTPTQPSPLAAAASRESRVSFNDSEPSWENKLLDRIARELGVLVHQLAEYDGAAFNSYKNALSQPIDYAGLPRPRPQSLRQRRRNETSGRTDTENPDSTLFSPTLPQTPSTTATTSNNPELTDTSLWGIEEEPGSDEDPRDALTSEQEYWQRDIDVRMIFSYLRDRFSRVEPSSSSPPQPSTSPFGPLPASWATPSASTTPATQASRTQRAEVIRRQHPLVSRAETRRKDLLAQVLAAQSLAVAPQKRASSCASQSTKRSRRSRGSSRNYWDLGGDNSASWSASGGGAAEGGGWGEV